MADHERSCNKLDEFEVVKHRKRRERRKIRPDLLLEQLTIMDSDEVVDIDRIKRRIRHCREDLIASDFFKRIVDTLEKALRCQPRFPVPDTSSSIGQKKGLSADVPRDLDMLVYGLGNFATCHIASYQLALMLALRDQRIVSCDRCDVYDPRFTWWEKQILTDEGCSVIPHNEEGKRLCSRPTLVFMPHCGKALFNNFLWANWKLDVLTNLVILGNSFSSIICSLPLQRLKSYNYIQRIQVFMLEDPVTNNFVHKDIFNDMSIHWFPFSKLQQASLKTWQDTPEPVYDCEELEIILAS
ncbi:SRR1-like protein [Pomacea canaliculata]|uniref:SRR1-like protein n=1 Tax=Pomacea canaliculata TaxID=400727 RepID=UPI000D738427|nr:SRR1-like protein [Pomacea canaliculata]